MTRRPRLEEIGKSLSADEQSILDQHLRGGTSANWLSQVLTAHGFPISATTLKAERARLQRQDV